MSEKSSRFGSLRGVLRENVAPVPEAKGKKPASAPAPVEVAKPAPFSNQMFKLTQRRLKQAAAIEDRPQFEILEAALADYFAKHHPELLK